jgi:hypothetical protein
LGIKDELSKKPEDLTESQLKKAKGLAGALTQIRQICYFAIDIFVVFYVVYSLQQYAMFPFNFVLILIGVIYALFKARDFMRGDN